MLQKVAWSEAIGRALNIALPGDDLLIVGREVREGRAELWRFTGQTGEGYVVTRVEVEPEYKELVMVAGQGSGLVEGAKEIMAFANQHGITRFRVHIQNPAVMRLFRGLGFIQTQVVMSYGQ